MNYFATLLFLILCGSGLKAQSVLEYRLKKDDVFTIKQNAEQKIIQELDGASHEITNTIDGILEFKVLAQPDSAYALSLTFKDINLKMTSSIQGELMNVSAKMVNEDDMQSKIFSSLLNRPVQILLSKNGDIIEVTGGDSLVTTMAAASGLEDKFSLNMMKKSLEKEFGSEALSNSYEQMTFIYPNKPVQVGDTWKNKYLGNLSAENTWTLEALSENDGSISGTANITMNVVEMTTTMKLSGMQQTQITIDPSSGFIKKMIVEGEYQGVSTATQMGDQEIPTAVKSKISYELMDGSVE
ncbi:hypothetical protein LCGC14_1489290 [marine sediment metagenome]|uniref:Uncharacterized protein n=2 Tax=root TaxID=1 RepID=A0A831QP48_9FLAO|nr:hypothetical protein [Pricia antarctica]